MPASSVARPPAPAYRRFDPPATSSLPVADQPVSWQDLTLMLRTGLSDEEVLAALRGKQLVCFIGTAQAATLRELGAGAKLLNDLRTRPRYAAPLTLPRVTVTASALPTEAAPPGGGARPEPSPAPLPDHAANDRQIKSLQSRIDAVDAQILELRSHPDSLALFGTYNGRGARDGEESPLKKILDELDQQRNDLRRQKWRLEGR